MKRTLALAAILGFAALGAWTLLQSPPRPAAAQVEPTPSPDPHIYDDRAMHLVVPAAFVLVSRTEIPPDKLQSNLTPVAAWVRDPGKDDAVAILLQMEYFTGNLDQFVSDAEEQIREQLDGALITTGHKGALKNGMPAAWMKVVYGSGFSARIRYQWAWIDGTRGIVLAIDGRNGKIDEQTARAALSDVRATAYPIGEP